MHARRKMQTAALVLSLVASVAGTGPYCEEWCGKNTCNLYEYCGACIAANDICSKQTRPCLASSCSKSTFDTKHRMCTQASDSECGNECTCDDYIKPPPPPLSPPPPLGEQSPSAPPPTPAMPPVTCDAFNSGLRVCRVRRDRIDHRFLELNAVPPTLDEVP